MNPIGWDPTNYMTDHNEVVKDHEDNPEYELHVGRLISPGKGTSRNQRFVSVWIQGKRFSGYLSEQL